VAFDASCARLGMGKGCYDRLLPEMMKATVIALAFEAQLVEKVPAGEHDRPVDVVVTEGRIIRRGGSAP